MKKQIIKVTLTDKIFGNHTSEVYFDGAVYRWVSNDRVPPSDTVRDYEIDKLPGFDADVHALARQLDIQKFLKDHFLPKKERMTIKKQAEIQVEAAKRAVQKSISHLRPHPMGHAFLWGTVKVILKNGKSRSYKACLGSVCAADLVEACRLAGEVPNVSDVSYNLD